MYSPMPPTIFPSWIIRSLMFLTLSGCPIRSRDST